jgi:hypothetical protein
MEYPPLSDGGSALPSQTEDPRAGGRENTSHFCAPDWNRTSTRLLSTVPKTVASSISATSAYVSKIVRPTGFEPARAFAHQHLKLACLPRLHHGRIRADDRIRTCTGFRPPRPELGVSTKTPPHPRIKFSKCQRPVSAARVELARALSPVGFRPTASTVPATLTDVSEARVELARARGPAGFEPTASTKFPPLGQKAASYACLQGQA